MGLFSKIFPKTSVAAATNGYFQTLTAYSPMFTTFEGGIYESLLCRASVNSIATHCSKLKLEVNGSAGSTLDKSLKYKPNPWQTTSQWLYRTATILEVDNTAFIVPLLDPSGTAITGVYTVRPSQCELVDYAGQPWYKFRFPTGEVAVIESDRTGTLMKYQYKDDFFGSDNSVLYPTLDVLKANDTGLVEGLKSGASIRFLAKLAQTLKSKDIEEEKARFVDNNLTGNTSGVMMYDAKYSDVKQIESHALLIDDKQLQQIKNNVYSHFGTNEEVLMNNFSEDQWNAFYEGCIEPLAIQMSEVLTGMIFNNHEYMFGNEVKLTSNRLEYASNATKLNVVTQLMDRGMLSRNEGREIFNLGEVEDGDKYYIRTEYSEANRLTENQGLDDPKPDDSAAAEKGGTGNASQNQ